MNKRDLFKLIEDEVSAVVNEPLTEPQKTQKPLYKPVLQNEDDIDDILFYTGNTPEEVKEKRDKRKNNKKLLSFGKY